jgi:molecular chaperone DnaK (HSP70)
MKIAIDFGTTNTVVAQWLEKERKSQTIRLPEVSTTPTNNIPPLIPSLVYVENANNNSVLIGSQVTRCDKERFFSNFKRDILQKHNIFSKNIDGREITPEQVGEYFISKLIEKIPKTREIIITRPLIASDKYICWLLNLYDVLGNDIQIRTIDEPTAAAIGYGIDMPNSRILVIDFGGGTLDCCLIKTPSKETIFERLGRILFRQGKAKDIEESESIAKEDEVLGGMDIDNWLVEDVLERYNLRGSDPLITPNIMMMTRVAEDTKKALSSLKPASFNFIDADSGRIYNVDYSLSDFNKLLERKGFFYKLEGTINNVLAQAQIKGVKKEMIDAVIMTGGTTLIPAVKERVRRIFPNNNVRDDKPFEAVAHGALALLYGMEIKDFIYHSYGIRGWHSQNKSHMYEVIIKPQTRYPTKEPIVREYPVANENAEYLDLIIGEISKSGENKIEEVLGDRILGQDEKLVEEKRAVQLNESSKTIRLNPLGQPRKPRIRCEFRIDENRILRITLTDILTNKVLLDNTRVVELR